MEVQNEIFPSSEDFLEAAKKAEFSCPVNPDVERFFKHSGRLLGYFTLALKPLTVRGETVSNTYFEFPHF